MSETQLEPDALLEPGQSPRALLAAAGDLDEAHRLMRGAVKCLSDAGLHHQAEEVTVALDALDAVRARWASE